MSTSILTTKFYPPPIPQEMVFRPRLIEKLMPGLSHRLTLISAPAGYGKTTLLSELVQLKQMNCAWISLDSEDNDPVGFWSYFITAIHNLEPDVGEVALRLLHSLQSPSIRSVLTTILNELTAKTNFSNPHILIFDHYNIIDNRSIQEDMTFLIDHLPPQLRLVIATRIDPPLPLARLRSRDHLSEIRTEELRFTYVETATLLNEVIGLKLTDKDIAVINERTEGWIASLQMAAISMQGREDITHFIRAFSGSNRYILDYLTEEVLNQLSPTESTFLLETSILDLFNADLCNAITGRQDSKELFRKFETANLFIVPLDDRREWYRYHRLFIDLLRQHLNQLKSDIVPGLHILASEWYKQKGLEAQAINHALRANDYDRAADLIEQYAEKLFMRGEFTKFQSWVQVFPDDIVGKWPMLCIYHAISLIYTGHSLNLVESRLKQAEDSNRSGTATGGIMVLRSIIALLKGDAPSSIELSHQALKLLPAENLFLRHYVTGMLGLIHIMKGNLSAAIQSFEELARIGQKTGNMLINFMAMRRLAELHIAQGQLYEAKIHYEQILEIAVDAHKKRLPSAGIALMGLGELMREWNALDVAENYLNEGIELVCKYGDIWTIGGLISLARVKMARGHVEKASELIQKAIQIAKEFDLSQLEDIFIGQHQARFYIKQGKFESAVQCMEESKLASASGPGFYKIDSGSYLFNYIVNELSRNTHARLLIAQGEAAEALALLSPLLEEAEKQERIRSIIEISILEALAHQLNDEDNALTSLRRALTLAKPADYIRIFVDEGEPMVRLLKLAQLKNIEPEYIAKLLTAFTPAELGDAALKAEPHGVFQSAGLLSERELQVLRLLEAGLSNRDIAEQLVISLGTVKKHVFNIYSKLNVEKRTQAIARARTLGLV